MNQNPLREITQEMAGHIRHPMESHEIAKELEGGEYSAELMIQHLLLFVDRMQDPHAVRAMAQRCKIALGDDGLCDNEFKFCPYCGKTLTETPYDEESDT